MDERLHCVDMHLLFVKLDHEDLRSRNRMPQYTPLASSVPVLQAEMLPAKARCCLLFRHQFVAAHNSDKAKSMPGLIR